MAPFFGAALALGAAFLAAGFLGLSSSSSLSEKVIGFDLVALILEARLGPSSLSESESEGRAVVFFLPASISGRVLCFLAGETAEATTR